jgi:hypothetical protein
VGAFGASVALTGAVSLGQAQAFVRLPLLVLPGPWSTRSFSFGSAEVLALGAGAFSAAGFGAALATILGATFAGAASLLELWF